AVSAAIRHRDGDVDQLLRQGSERAGRHYRLHPLPRRLEKRRVMGERAPEIVDEVGLALRPDVVEDGAGLGPRRPVGENRDHRHQTTAMIRAGPPVPVLCLGAPMKIVAPLAGNWSRLAMFSMPKRPPGSQEKCTAKSAELPGSSESVSTAIEAAPSSAR